MILYQDIRSLHKRKEYNWRDGINELNPFGIRSKDMLVDEFNDTLGVAYIDNFGNQQCLVFKGTTKPGYYWLKKKMGNVNGTFILCPGFYEDCWRLGKHKGRYDALIQKGTGIFKGWRDNDSDGELDYSGDIYDDVTGLNWHTTSFDHEIERVNAYSAGCQVNKDDLDHLVLIALWKKHFENYKTIDYALF